MKPLRVLTFVVLALVVALWAENPHHRFPIVVAQQSFVDIPVQGGTLNSAFYTASEEGTYRVSAYWTNNGGTSGCGVSPRLAWTDNSNASSQDSIYYIPPFYNTQPPYGQ